MKLQKVTIHFRAFGADQKPHEMQKPVGYTMEKAVKFIIKKFHCKTAIVFSIDIDGEVILNTGHEPFQIVKDESSKNYNTEYLNQKANN